MVWCNVNKCLLLNIRYMVLLKNTKPNGLQKYLLKHMVLTTKMNLLLLQKLNTIWVLLYLIANFEWLLHQLNIKNIFLNGELRKKVYMNLPPGFENLYSSNNVCKLRRPLYSLKQSPYIWFERFIRLVISTLMMEILLLL